MEMACGWEGADEGRGAALGEVEGRGVGSGAVAFGGEGRQAILSEHNSLDLGLRVWLGLDLLVSAAVPVRVPHAGPALANLEP